MEQRRVNLTEGFKEVSNYIKWTSYVIGALATAGFVFGLIQLLEVHSLLSNVISGFGAGILTSDNVSPLLTVTSMELSLAFGAIAISGILSGSTAVLYAEWRNINSKAYSEYLIRHAAEDIKEEIRSNRLNLNKSTTRQDNQPK
jgi:hypothetical protein